MLTETGLGWHVQQRSRESTSRKRKRTRTEHADVAMRWLCCVEIECAESWRLGRWSWIDDGAFVVWFAGWESAARCILVGKEGESAWSVVMLEERVQERERPIRLVAHDLGHRSSVTTGQLGRGNPSDLRVTAGRGSKKKRPTATAGPATTEAVAGPVAGCGRLQQLDLETLVLVFKGGFEESGDGASPSVLQVRKPAFESIETFDIVFPLKTPAVGRRHQHDPLLRDRFGEKDVDRRLGVFIMWVLGRELRILQESN
ncbi:hypothetical protein SISNIDRAFT_471787, partial [Sistotremastrum niveocremeum HHB9708]